MTRTAVALRAFSIGENPGEQIAEGQELTLDAGQYADFVSSGLVRATDPDPEMPAGHDPAAAG